MLEGWKLHHDPNMDMRKSWINLYLLINLSFLSEYSDELGQVEGNDFRDIWKTSCWKMLDEVNYFTQGTFQTSCLHLACL